MTSITEQEACTPTPLNQGGFNARAVLPYDLQVSHIQSAMQDFIDFLGFINSQLYTKSIPKLESMLMSANFSSMVGEFMSAAIPKYCMTLTKNRHHNGHPDLVPVGYYINDDVLHGPEGIEIKASRYTRGWQATIQKTCGLMVFVFDSNRSKDTEPKKFKFVSVSGAKLNKSDWNFSGRSGDSRRTITASVMPSGFSKMSANWIYTD